MKITYRATFIFLSLALIFAFSGAPLNAHQAMASKGELKEVVFIHRPAPPDFAKGKHVAGCTVTTNDNINDYKLTGWHMPSTGLTYKINFNTLPAGISQTAFQNAIAASTQTWSQASNNAKWAYGGATNIKRSASDGVNLITFGNASGAIAVTRTWYWTATGEVAESDMTLSSNLAWSITNPNNGDCGGATGTYDVQNIATHEFGHQVGLNDLYVSADKDLTMYGYGTMKELKKDSLGTGDTSGVKAVAP